MFKAVLVDDEQIMTEGLKRLINWEALGVELIFCAYDGQSALGFILKEKPDIVVTDIKMPVMDGLQMIQEARAHQLDTNFIILSGYGEFEYAQKALRYGVKEYLLKPCNEREIEKSLEKVVVELRIKSGESKNEDEGAQPVLLDTVCVTQLKLCVEKYLNCSELSLKWLAENKLYMNADYLSKQFLKVTGERFSCYLNRIRVDKAMSYIEALNEETIASIAEKVGLGHNPQYFSKIFKKSVGYTPGEYYRICYNNRNLKKYTK